MKSKVQKRSRFYNLPVQLKYAVLLSLVAGFISLVMIFMVSWFIQRNYNLFMGDDLGVSLHVIEVVKREQKLLENGLFLLFMGTVTTMFAVSLYVTRKLSGPMLALHRHLSLMSQGERKRLFKLRKNDEFKEIEPLINSMELTTPSEVSAS